MDNDVELTPVRPQHRFDQGRLRDYLHRSLDADFGTMQVEQFEGGQSNPTFLLTTEDNKYVMRKKPPGVLLKSAHAVDREYRVITALKDTDVPVPMTHLMCDDADIIGTPFYVMEMVEGRVLIDTYLPSFTPAERQELYRSFVESLAAIHKVDYAEVGLEDFGRPGNYYSRQIHRWSQQYRASETEKNPSMDAIMEWLPGNVPESDESTIVHGDFRLPNCIIHPTEPKIVAIIDWELSTIGHPLVDLPYWCSMEYHSDKPVPDDPDGLPTEQDLLDHYCELMGIDEIEHWTFYLAFNLFRTAAIRQGVYKRGLDGNASSDRWQLSGPGGRASAIKAWELVHSAGLA